MLDTLREAPARIARGWARTVARVEGTEGQKAQEAETRTSLGLMAQARAAPEMTPEQQIFLSQSEHGMRERLSVLLGIPHRTLAQEREKVAIEAWLTRDAPAPAPAIRPLFGAVPALGLLGGVRLWMILAAGWAVTGGALAVQTALKERIEDQRDAARSDLAQATRERDDWRERAGLYETAVADARATAEQTAQALNQERRRQAVAARRERERQRDVQNILAGSSSSEPPPWDERLRNDQPVQERPGAGD